MADPFIGEIKMFAGNYAPQGWAFCDGQLLNISGNDALYSLLLTTYGGDGRTTFGLPDLRGRVPIHHGQGSGLPDYGLGEQGGAATETLTMEEMPVHNHDTDVTVRACSGGGDSNSPGDKRWAATRRETPYSSSDPDSEMAGAVDVATQDSGEGVPHNNMPPYTAVAFIIALVGVYPSRS